MLRYVPTKSQWDPAVCIYPLLLLLCAGGSAMVEAVCPGREKGKDGRKGTWVSVTPVGTPSMVGRWTWAKGGLGRN